MPADNKATAKVWNDAMADVIDEVRAAPVHRRLVQVSAAGFKKLEVVEKKIRRVAGTTGLEPATSDVTGRRSNQLNYVPASTSNIIRLSRRVSHMQSCTRYFRETGPGGPPGYILQSMRPLPFCVAALAALLVSCGSDPKPATPAAEAPKPVEPAKPLDETRRFSMTNLVDTKVFAKELMGKSFMPGGTVARYKKGKLEYEMFVAKFPSPDAAAITLPDWRKALTDSKLVPSFGGYFGQDNGRPVFVFSKGNWIAGIAGLPEKDADTEARGLASKLN